MKAPTLLLSICIMTWTLLSCGTTVRTELGYDYAKAELEQALKNKSPENILVDSVITGKETAVAIAESILFEIYKQENIVKQRPYEIHHINGYWIINGTLPKGRKGGTFFIILNAKNGEVIKLSHGK